MKRPDREYVRPTPEGYQITLTDNRVVSGGAATRELSAQAICAAAADMVAAAALAEVEAAAIKVLCKKRRSIVYDPDTVVQTYLHHLRGCYTVRQLGSWDTILLYPRVALPYAKPVIDLYFAGHEPWTRTPDQAREMAAQWLRVASGVPEPSPQSEADPYAALRSFRAGRTLPPPLQAPRGRR